MDPAIMPLTLKQGLFLLLMVPVGAIGGAVGNYHSVEHRGLFDPRREKYAAALGVITGTIAGIGSTYYTANPLFAVAANMIAALMGDDAVDLITGVARAVVVKVFRPFGIEIGPKASDALPPPPPPPPVDPPYGPSQSGPERKAP